MAKRIPVGLIRGPWTPAEGRKFAFPVGGAFLVLSAVLWWRDHPTAMLILGTIGVLLLAAGAVIPGRLQPVHHAWMEFAHGISKVTTPIFMSIIYFGVITPVGLVRRAMGRNPLRPGERTTTYWISRDAGARRSDLERQF